jgi:hypothetical protein
VALVGFGIAAVELAQQPDLLLVGSIARLGVFEILAKIADLSFGRVTCRYVITDAVRLALA